MLFTKDSAQKLLMAPMPCVWTRSRTFCVSNHGVVQAAFPRRAWKRWNWISGR